MLKLVVTQLAGPSYCPMRTINYKDNLSILYFPMGRGVFLKHSWSLSMPLFTSFQRMLTHLTCKFEKKEQDTTAELPFLFLGANYLQQGEFSSEPLCFKFSVNRPPVGEACLERVCHDLQGRQENILNSSLVGPLSYQENYVLQSIFGGKIVTRTTFDTYTLITMCQALFCPHFLKNVNINKLSHQPLWEVYSCYPHFLLKNMRPDSVSNFRRLHHQK